MDELITNDKVQTLVEAEAAAKNMQFARFETIKDVTPVDLGSFLPIRYSEQYMDYRGFRMRRTRYNIAGRPCGGIPSRKLTLTST